MGFASPRQAGKRQEKATAKAVFLSKCNGCEDCVSFCPKEAISVENIH
jgi:ferredoxin